MEKPNLLMGMNRTRLLVGWVALALFSSVYIVSSRSFASNKTLSFPQPLIAEKPLGSLIYAGSTAGGIQSAGDANSYTLPVNAGETITVNVTTGASLQATINLIDPSSNLIGTAQAAAAGQEVVLQTAAASATGTYTITVAGANSTTGNFAARVTLNAALDIAAHGGAENSTLATAQDVSPSSVGLTAVANRLAVVGHFDGTDDFYSFALQAGQSASLALELASSASVTLELDDASGNVLATGVTGAQNVTLIVQSFVAPVAGTYYARLTGTGQSDYSLIVTRSAAFEVEPNDQAHAQSLDVTPRALGDIGNGVAKRDMDWYSFSVNAGDNLTLTTTTPSDQGGEFDNDLVPQIDLYDNNLDRVATNQKQPKNTPVTWTALTSGTYFARVSGAHDSAKDSVANHFVGEYVLDVEGATGH
jgi:hypothetical protein